jgi:signal recognition particle subunit SRP54
MQKMMKQFAGAPGMGMLGKGKKGKKGSKKPGFRFPFG